MGAPSSLREAQQTALDHGRDKHADMVSLGRPPSMSSFLSWGKVDQGVEQGNDEAVVVVGSVSPGPDGTARGWLTVLGSFAAITATLGVSNAVGLLLSYLKDHQLRTFCSRDIGWIAAANICLTLSVPVLAGPLFDRHGPRGLLLGGAVLFSGGLLLASFVDGAAGPLATFGVLMLSWGILCGSGAGLVSTAVTGAVCHWFDRQRGLACGLVFLGSSVGGVAWPLLLRDTLGRWGWACSLRLVGGAAALLLVLANVLVRGVFPGARERPLLSARCLRQADFMWMTMSLAVFQFVVMGVVSTLPSWGASMGFDRVLIFSIVAAMNAGSGVGRVAVGALSDQIGRFNSVILVKLFSLLVVFGLFLNVGSSSLRFYIFAPCWGLGTGAILSMMSVLIGEVCKKEELGMYFGTNSFITSIAGLLCVPLSAQILESYGTTAHVVFFGSLCVLSTVLLVISRWAFLQYSWIWAAKV